MKKRLHQRFFVGGDKRLVEMVAGAVFLICSWPSYAEAAETDFDVVIAGGSTAAFAAAVSASQSGARVALMEPTDWVGGQITSSGVPAIDEAWHKIRDAKGAPMMDVAKIARTPENMSPLLREMLDATGCPGGCWVSRFCFLPSDFLNQHLLPLEQSQENLTVFRNTVIRDVRTERNRIVGIVAIQRTAKTSGYARLPSADLPDWYSPKPSTNFDKRVIKFKAHENTVFIDATEWGEVLALADAPYLIGVETKDGGLQGNETIGQSITFGFVQSLHSAADPKRDSSVPKPQAKQLGFGDYEGKESAWQLIWTYRRLASSGKEVRAGDLSLQNWGYYPKKSEGGNDYPFGYLFLDKQQTRQQKQNWVGGIDLQVLAAAEQRAYAWHHYFKSRASEGGIQPDCISLSTDTLGTRHGLSKLPYIRDTRRSIGIDDFLLRVSDLTPEKPGELARTFDDRVALGAYPVDIHPLANTTYPDYINQEYDVAPFTIPFRSLTNKRFGNLLVAGKTMAQSFLANAATRLHPTEWSSGTAAGIAAAYMSEKEVNSRAAWLSIDKLQKLIAERNPIDWQDSPD